MKVDPVVRAQQNVTHRKWATLKMFHAEDAEVHACMCVYVCVDINYFTLM